MTTLLCLLLPLNVPAPPDCSGVHQLIFLDKLHENEPKPWGWVQLDRDKRGVYLVTRYAWNGSQTHKGFLRPSGQGWQELSRGSDFPPIDALWWWDRERRAFAYTGSDGWCYFVEVGR